jgi:hypothetical protein
MFDDDRPSFVQSESLLLVRTNYKRLGGYTSKTDLQLSGSERGSVRLSGSAAVCGSAAVRQCGSVQQCSRMCAAVRGCVR